MLEQKPPPWGDDPLSTFFSEAEYNERASSLNLAPIYAFLQRLHASFRRVEETVEKDNREELLLTRFLMVRAHSSFLAATRLAMSGQLFESYAPLRSSIEQAWYALHTAKDRQPPKRSEIWLCRNEVRKGVKSALGSSGILRQSSVPCELSLSPPLPRLHP